MKLKDISIVAAVILHALVWIGLGIWGLYLLIKLNSIVAALLAVFLIYPIGGTLAFFFWALVTRVMMKFVDV